MGIVNLDLDGAGISLSGSGDNSTYLVVLGNRIRNVAYKYPSGPPSGMNAAHMRTGSASGLEAASSSSSDVLDGTNTVEGSPSPPPPSSSSSAASSENEWPWRFTHAISVGQGSNCLVGNNLIG